MTEQVSSEQLLRSALEMASTDLEAAYTHARSALRDAGTGTRWKAIQALENTGAAQRLINQLLEEETT